MKLKDMVNQDTQEVIKKLLYGLDYKTSYVVEFLHDTSVEVREVKKVRTDDYIREVYEDKETNEIIFIEK